MTTLDLAGLLDLLGYTDGEYVQFCNKAAGQPFQAITLANAPVNAPQDRDAWFGVNPVEHVTQGRPGADQVTRLAALWVDLDVKANGCPDFGVARAIVDDLSGLLGTRPVAITYSGHGMQPIWAVEGGKLDDRMAPGAFRPSDARALLRRWGRLVAAVAERRGAKVDSLYDLPRLLRCPGTVNHKAAPLPVHCLADTGAPLDLDAILDTLDENGIEERPEDCGDPGAVVVAPSEWEFASAPCRYAQQAFAGWALDSPDARHPWLLAQATRIAAMHRNGCLPMDTHRAAIGALSERFRALLDRDPAREPHPGEISDALGWGVARAAAMSAGQLASELGGHPHRPEILPPDSDDPFGYVAPRKDTDEHLPDVPNGLQGATASPRSQGAPQGSADDRTVAPTVEGNLNAATTLPAVPAALLAALPGDRPGNGALDRQANQQNSPSSGLPQAQGEGPSRGGTGSTIGYSAAVEQKALELRVLSEARALEAARTAPPPSDLDGEYLDITELDTLPRPDPLVDGVLARHTYIVLRGRDGTYKTFVALDWSLNLAAGSPWQGLPTQRAKVLYIAGEGAYGISSRVKAWEHAWQRRVESGWFTLRRSAVNLFVGGPVLDDLIDRITKGEYGLVVVDTLRRASGGADGNGSDMGVVVDNIERIKRATAAGSVLVITHTDKGDNDSRGYSGIEDDADIVWHSRPGESAGVIELTNAKMKDGPDGGKFTLKTVSVLDSLVLEHVPSDGDPDDLVGTDRLIVDTLRRDFIEFGCSVTTLMEVLEISKATLYRSRGRLIREGLVELSGPEGRVMRLSAKAKQEAAGGGAA